MRTHAQGFEEAPKDMRKNHTPLLTTVLMFILCTTILVGATTAYFTENVQVTGNVVQSGNLKAGMDWTDSLVPDANGQISWIDAADEKAAENKIFNYSQWEPGFTAVRYIRIRNEGRLAFQYQLNILSSEAPKAGPNLMDVIDVYYGVVPEQVMQEDGTLFPSTHVKDYADFDAFTQALGLEKMGTLSQLNANTGKTWGVMLPESGADLTLVPEENRETAYIGSEQFCIVLHMQESAGNEYQKLDMGEGFQLQLNATQYTYESDSFGSDYDAEAKSELPTYAGPVTATASIADKVDSESKLMEAITLSSGDVSATVPAGAKVVANATSLTLRITPLTDSSADINLTDSEETASYDVHVEGLAADNAVPLIVHMGEVLPKGLNMGNYGLYHVESNISNPMTLVDAVAALTAHNQFAYDPATGEVTVAMATFSEVAVVADTVNVWNGTVATSFAAGDGTETTPYIIANADQLAYMGERVSNDNTNYGSAYYKLISNINIGGVDNYKTNGRQVLFYPIGYNKVGGTTTDKGNWYTYGGSFKGIFDGNGHTITGIYQNTWAMVGDYSGTYYNDAMGLFGYVNGGTVKNLTIDSFYSEGEFAPTGCVTAYAAGNATFENIAITNSHPQTYNTGVAGIVGWDNGGDTDAEASNFTFKNITVDSTNTVSALWGSWDVGAAGLLGYLGEYSTAELNNCHVSATIDVYNDVCGNYQYYWYRYCGMLIGTVDKTKDDGSLDLSNITATNCTVNFGDRHEYYYCEFVKNSLASYTHDHQFSRIDHSELNFTDSNGNGRVDTNEVETVTGCTHDHASAGYESKDINGDGVVDSNMPLEDKQAVHIPFYQIFGGYGWGVNGYDIDTLPNLDINADQKGVEDNDIEDSSEKFATANTAKDTYTTGTTVSIGDLFTANSNATTAIDVDNVQVTVSPVNGSTAGGTYTANTTDWTQGRLTFSGLGQATITITDYYYCTPTTITVTVAEPASVDKFAPNDNLAFAHTTEGGTVEKTLGDIFTAIDGMNIVSSTVEVTIDGGSCSYTPNTIDWTQGTLAFTGIGEVSISITDNDYCNTATATVTITEPTPVDKFALVFENTDKYLYRVGNANTVALGSLFKAIDGVDIGNVTINVEALNGAGVSGTYSANASDWTKGTIQFSGTGPVQVTIDDDAYANALSLYLEVVDATNVTAYTSLGNRNSVLLNDITMSSGGSYYLSGATLYGNGFTFDVTDGAYSGTGSVSNNYLISLNNANLDNVKIVGAVYTSYGAQAANDYNRPVVLSTGSNTITNSYISNCAAPIRVKDGNLEIVNSTLKGGNFANLDIRGGHVILDHVTTINQVNGNDTAEDGTVVVGLGVVVYYENVLSTTTVEIKNGVTQYNHLSETQAETYITDDTASTLVSAMFNSDYSAVQYNDGSDTWVNTGILSMTGAVGDDNISDVGGYVEASPSMTGVTGYLHTKKPDATSIAATVPAYTTAGQGAIAPSYSFDYTTKNYVAKADGSNDYCYENNGTVLISMDEGDTFAWDTSILTATKNGQTLDYTVFMDGADYTGKSIAFNTAGDYTVEYTYIDSNNYDVVEEGVTPYNKTYTKTVNITVAVIKATTKHAEFTFGSSNQATEKITVGNNTYISATDVSHDNSTWSYITVGSTKIYYPIVEATIVDKKVAYFNVFKNIVTITDYADGGTGAAVTYNSSTTTMPSGLTVVKGIYKAFADISSNWSTLNDTALTLSDASNVFKYAGSASASATPTTYNDALCFASPEVTNSRDEYITMVQYSYTDATNTTYYYYVGYHMAEKGDGSCLTPDTLITLADGAQTRVDSLTGDEQLLVWNMETGALDSAPIMFIDNDAEAEYEVIHLYFSDGTDVKVIYEHGFWDYDLNRYVYLDENAAQYLGHSFFKRSGNGGEKVTLTSVVIETETTTAWSPVTADHLCYFVNGMLSMPGGVGGLFNIFDVDPATMTYDMEAMARDIETYGLFTYEELAEICPALTEEMFEAAGGAYLKVSIGKGNLTMDELVNMINRYAKFF